MSTAHQTSLSAQPAFSSYYGLHAVYVQSAFIASAVLLPIAAHLLGAPVRVLLPMHWPVLLAGMVYGWKAGAMTGALAPLISYLVSGYPMPNILPSMTFELFTYGFVVGVLRQRFNVNAFVSTTIAIFAGRIMFVLLVLVTARASITNVEYFRSALVPGIIPAMLQIIILPFIAQWLIKKYDTQ